jgi:phenylalanyl-tRNA synthetase beta chain
LDIGAEVKTVQIRYPDQLVTTPDLQPKPVAFSARFLNEVIGTAISKTDLNRYLARMDLYATGTQTILVPTYRTDIFSEIDIAGDLLVAVGIDNLTADRSGLQFYNSQSDPLKDFAFKVGDFAQRMSLMEVKSFILSDPELLTWFSDRYIQADNAKSRAYSAARVSLQAGLLEILSRNISAPKPINIYEIGEVIQFTATQAIYETIYWGFASLDARASFATAKSYVQTLLKAFAIEYDLQVCQEKRYIPGRAATVMIHGQVAGHFGEIHPALLNHFSFPEPVCSGELDCRILRR